MHYAVVDNTSNIVREVLADDPGVVNGCRVVSTEDPFVPSSATHLWEENSGAFTLLGRRNDTEGNHHAGRAAELLAAAGYEGSLDMDEIEAWFNVRIDAAADLGELKSIIKPGLSGIGHLAVAASYGWRYDTENGGIQ